METKNRLIFCDVETAGFHRKSPIIELAAIAVEAGTYRELDAFDAKVQFSMQDPYVDLAALGVNKFSPAIWERYAVPPERAAKNFSRLLSRHATEEFANGDGNGFFVAKLAAHNADFDNTRLRRWCTQHLPRSKGRRPFFPGSYLALCTVQKADWFFHDNQGLTPPSNLKLPTLAEYFGLRNQPDHSALNDVRATVELAQVIAAYQRGTVTARAA